MSNDSREHSFACTDLGNAERFIHRYGDKVRHLHETGRWLFWNGSRWKPVPYSKIFGMAKKTIKGIYNEARDCNNKTAARELSMHAVRSENYGRLRCMIETVSKSEPVSTSVENFDTERRKINCLNGIVNLETGELVSHAPRQLVIKQACVEYDPEATCPRFDKFLGEVFLDDKDLIEYVLKILGYAITGETVEQKVFIWYGLGANGKTTLSETLLSILGDYARPTELDMLLASDKSQVRLLESVGKLKGMRLALASETDSTRKFSESMVKKLSGEETLTGAVLTKGQFDFSPTHKIMILVNHLPGVKDGSHSIWRRLVPIPFRRKFTDKEIDPYLKQILLAERKGIFAKIVNAARSYLRDGLGQVPKCISDLSEEYRERNDVLGRFIKECLEPDPASNAPARETYRAYEGWCGKHGVVPASESFFSDGMVEREISKKRKPAGMVYLGYRLKGQTNDASEQPKSGFKSLFGAVGLDRYKTMSTQEKKDYDDRILRALHSR